MSPRIEGVAGRREIVVNDHHVFPLHGFSAVEVDGRRVTLRYRSGQVAEFDLPDGAESSSVTR